MRWPRMELGIFGHWDLDRLYDIQAESVLVYWIMIMRRNESEHRCAIVFQGTIHIDRFKLIFSKHHTVIKQKECSLSPIRYSPCSCWP